MNGAGDFVVVWDSDGYSGNDGQDGSDVGVFGQRYDAAGNPSGPEFRVPQATLGRQRAPSVGLAGDGSFVVAWAGHTQAGAYDGILARRFDASGNPLTGDVFVGWASFSDHTALAMNDSGDFVVVSDEMRGRRFDASANALGPEFVLDPSPSPLFSDPYVAIDAAGAFVTTWDRGSETDVAARSFDDAGNPVP